MKKIVIVAALLFTFTATVIFIGCSSNKPSTQNPTPQTKNATSPNNTSGSNSANNANTTNNAAGKTFTISDLKNYTGANGSPAYVAVNGTVYDVTNARKWKSGTHFEHVAGVDLTSQMGNSPHGTSVLSGLPVVGTLK